MSEKSKLSIESSELPSDAYLKANWAYEDVTNLLHFTRNTLGYSRVTTKPHADLVDFLTNAGKYKGRLTNNWKLILLPRGTFKTTVAAQAYPLWRRINFQLFVSLPLY